MVSQLLCRSHLPTTSFPTFAGSFLHQNASVALNRQTLNSLPLPDEPDLPFWAKTALALAAQPHTRPITASAVTGEAWAWDRSGLPLLPLALFCAYDDSGLCWAKGRSVTNLRR